MTEKEDKILQQIMLELMFSNPQNREYEEGLTAVEIARKNNLKLAIVKKKLKILLEKKLVRSSGMSPKFWNFDEYNFDRMEETDPVYNILCNLDNIDFCKYFKYGK